MKCSVVMINNIKLLKILICLTFLSSFFLSTYLTGKHDSYGGASHAGEGGQNGNVKGKVYGNYLKPVSFGSGSRLTRGGGAVFLRAKTAIIKGLLSAKYIF